MKKRFLTLVAGMAFCSMNVFAQEAEEVAVIEEVEVEEEASSSELSISGSIDTYYRTVLGADNYRTEFDPAQGIMVPTGVQAPGSSFANGEGFSIGMANLIIEKSGEKTGFVADLVFGPRGEEAVFGKAPSSNVVNQLYAYWNVSDKLTMTLGNFNTFLGYEVISPAGNFNYSTSYLFSYGPFSHTGLKADYAISDEFSAMLAVMNMTDATSSQPLGQTDVYLGAQLGYTPEAGGAWLNFIYGHDQLNAGNLMQIDLTTGWDLSDAFYLGLNASTQIFNPDAEGADNSGFSGAALYLQYAMSDMFALGFRGEYFAETNNYLGVTNLDAEGDGSIVDLAVSGNIFLGDLTLIPEVRVDLAGQPSDMPDAYMWTTEGGTGDGTNSLVSVMLAAVYSF